MEELKDATIKKIISELENSEVNPDILNSLTKLLEVIEDNT